jgi:hypothetical protein
VKCNLLSFVLRECSVVPTCSNFAVVICFTHLIRFRCHKSFSFDRCILIKVGPICVFMDVSVSLTIIGLFCPLQSGSLLFNLVHILQLQNLPTTHASVCCVHLRPKCTNPRSSLLESSHMVLSVCNRAVVVIGLSPDNVSVLEESVYRQCVTKHRPVCFLCLLKSKSLHTGLSHCLIIAAPSFWNALRFKQVGYTLPDLPPQKGNFFSLLGGLRLPLLSS